MKLEVFDDRYVVCLNKTTINEVDFKIKRQVEECFRNVFTKIRRRLNEDINGFFNIKVYLDDNFGAILVIEKEELEYCDYFSNQIDMQIEIEDDSNVLLEFDDLFYIDEDTVYFYNGKYYINYRDKLKYVEFANVIYGDEAKKIIKNSIKVLHS